MPKRNLFDQPFERHVRQHRAPIFSDSERVAGRAIKRFFTDLVQRRRSAIGATVGAGAAAASAWLGFNSQDSIGFSSQMSFKSSGPSTTDAPMDVHGDACDGADKAFGRDAEGSAQQKAIASSLWNRAPRIYDDEIIVRMPLDILTYNTMGSQVNTTFTPGLATAGPPIVPNLQYLNQSGNIHLNDIYLPFQYDSTRRPRGYSWYSQLYNYYQVLECRWTVKVRACTDLLSTTTPSTADLPMLMTCQVSDNQHTALTTGEQVMELGHTNGADKSFVLERPLYITWQNGKTGSVQNTLEFSGTWTPAKFDDLQIDITRQPMTAVGASPNWLNWLDTLYVNYNTAQPTGNVYYQTEVSLEYLVHFKKINASKYLTAN